MTTKDEIDAFRQIPEISKWIKAADLRPRTKENYVLRLMQLFEKIKISHAQFLQDCNSNRRQLLNRIKVTLGEVREHSASVAFQQRAALINFVNFYQDQFDEPIAINYKVKLRRVHMKKGLTFEQAEKIIAECTHPYREISSRSFSGAGWTNQHSATSTRTLNSSLTFKGNCRIPRGTVRIDLPPRKANMDVYFVCVPKLAFENLTLPVSTRTHKLRNGDVKGGNPSLRGGFLCSILFIFEPFDFDNYIDFRVVPQLRMLG